MDSPSPTQRRLTAADITALVHASFGPQAGITHAAPLTGGGFAAVWGVRLGDGRDTVLTLPDRVLLVAVYWRTNLTMRQLGPLFGVSHSAAHRVIDTVGPLLALAPVRRRPKDQGRDRRWHPDPDPGSSVGRPE